MWSFQARKEFWMDVYFKPLLCQRMRGVVWDLSGEVARSVGGDHRFGGGQALPQRHQHLLEWCTKLLTGSTCLEVPTTFASAMIQSTTSPVHQRFTGII